MSVIVWNEISKRLYESGIDHGVLYPPMTIGVPWNGLVSIDENVVGGESTPYYYDGVKYLDIIAYEDFQATLTAISAPEEFNACDGTRSLAAGLLVTQQPRIPFHLSYRTGVSSYSNSRLGYKLHLVYNAMASPSGRSYKTRTDTVEPESRSWTIDTVPVPSSIMKPTAHFIINSTTADPDALVLLERHLYGYLDPMLSAEDRADGEISLDDLSPIMPTQAEVIDIFS